MRVFQPSCTKTVPVNAQIDYDNGTVTYENKYGICTAVLTKKGRMRITSETYHIDFVDHLNIRRRINTVSESKIKRNEREMRIYKPTYVSEKTGKKCKCPKYYGDFTDEKRIRHRTPLSEELKSAEYIAKQIERLVTHKKSGLLIPPDLQLWADKISYQIRDNLQKWGLIGARKNNRSLKKVKLKLPRVKTIRYFSDGELIDLYQITLTGPTRYGMSGQDRYVLYQFAADTGLRVTEIRSIQFNHIDFKNNCLLYMDTSSKKLNIIPLSYSIMLLLKQMANVNLKKNRVFGGDYKQLTDRTGLMLNVDSKDAGLLSNQSYGKILAFQSLQKNKFIIDKKELTKDKWLNYAYLFENQINNALCCGNCGVPIAGLHRKIDLWQIWSSNINKLNLENKSICKVIKYAQILPATFEVGICSEQCQRTTEYYCKKEIERSAKLWKTEIETLREVKKLAYKLAQKLRIKNQGRWPSWLQTLNQQQKICSSILPTYQ